MRSRTSLSLLARLRYGRRPSRRALTGLIALVAVSGGATAALSPAGSAFVANTSNPSSSLGAASAFPSYKNAILAESPYFSWRLDGAPGATNAPDSSVNARNGAFTATDRTTSPVLKGQPGAPAGNGNAAMRIPAPLALTGTSFTRSTLATSSPNLIASADFDADGHADLAIAQGSGTAQVLVYLGVGDGTFNATPSASLAGPTNPHAVAATDLNLDGKPDLVWTMPGSTQFRYAYGNGNGTFGTPVSVTLPWGGAYGLSIGDVDGNGYPDIATYTLDTGVDTVAVSLTNASGAPQAPTTYGPNGPSTQTYDAKLGDVNGDGLLDLVTTQNTPAQISVRLGTGGGAFSATNTTYPAGPNPQDETLVDLDNDGDLDVAVANGVDPGTVTALWNSGSGTFSATPTTYTGLGGYPALVMTADLDGDDRPDLATTNQGTSVSVITGSGVVTNHDTTGFGYGLAAADADEDGRQDLIAADGANGSANVFLNTTARPVTSTTGAIAAVTPVAGLNTFTAETWFKTTTSSGGKLLGFGSEAVRASAVNDRHVYMTDSGQLRFGVFPGSIETVGTTRAYNDGQWHQVVATLGAAGMRLYVDGALQASDPAVTSAETVMGYWRLGGDTLSNDWPGSPTSSYFAGSIDEFALYPTQLSTATISAHYAARTGTGYPAAVLVDGPSQYWRLADTATDGVVSDETANARTGRTTAPITLNWPGALGGSGAGTGSAYFGTDEAVGLGGAAITSPDVFSYDLWFRTVTTQGGKLLGFGDTRTATSGSQDRHLYMADDGKLYAGVYDTATRTVASTASYNDDAWHHAAVTFSPATGLALYVDGALVASGAAGVNPGDYSGYWRVGFDQTAGWPSSPTSNSFGGAIDEPTVYDKVLSATQVRAHYRSRNRSG